MRMLVTGGTGFVGSAVVRVLLRAGHEVCVLARSGGSPPNLRGLKVELRRGDLEAPETLGPALRGCQGLFHVAADYRLWVPDAARLYRVNVEGTRELLRAAADAGLERVVYTSSVAALGLGVGGEPADERTPAHLEHLVGPYKRSKFLAEREVFKLIDSRALPVVLVNPSTPVGPRDLRPTPTGRMLLDAVHGRIPAYVDTGLNVVHVDDVATGHLLAFERGRVGERYILGGENLSLRRILEEVARCSGRRPPRWRLPHAVVWPYALLSEWRARWLGGEPRATRDELRMARKHMYFSSDKARRELNYQPRPAAEALRDAVAWFRDWDATRGAS